MIFLSIFLSRLSKKRSHVIKLSTEQYDISISHEPDDLYIDIIHSITKNDCNKNIMKVHY